MEILLQKDEGRSFWVLGDLYTFKVTGRDTNGSYTVIEQIIQPQNGPPPHIHFREDETFYVLEGKFSFMCENKTQTLETGAFAHIPKGTLHTFRNTGNEKGRLLVFITPSGLEDFFMAIGTPLTMSLNPPPFDPEIINKLTKLATDFQMKILPPEN